MRWGFATFDNEEVYCEIKTDGQAKTGQMFSGSGFNDGNWHYGVLSHIDSEDIAWLFMDSEVKVDDNACVGSVTVDGDSFELLGWTGESEYFNGRIDEVRLSYCVRSHDWINATFNNMNHTNTFLDLGGEEEHIVGSWWNNDWHYSKKITIDHNMVDDDLVNFPVLVDNVSSSFIHAQGDGDDFVFVNSDNTTVFNHEIEWYNVSGDNRLIAWVNVTDISSTTDTDIWLYYGNSGCANQQNKAGTWDSGFEGVWHLVDNTSSTVNDSSNHIRHGSKYSANNPLENASGIVGFGQDFEEDRITLASGTDLQLGTGDFTYETWVLNTSSDKQFQIFDRYGTSAMKYYFYAGAGELAFHGYTSDKSIKIQLTANIDIVDGVWNYVAAVGDRGNQGYLYRNESNLTLSSSTCGADDFSYDQDLIVGSLGGDNTDFDLIGSLDEVRISSCIRDDSWLKATYYTIAGSDSFLTVGSETTQ